MAIVINLDVMLARHKMKSKELAAYIGITEQNLSLLKSGKVKGIRFSTLDKFNAACDFSWPSMYPINATRACMASSESTFASSK